MKFGTPRKLLSYVNFLCSLWLGLKLGSFNNQEEVIRFNKTIVLDSFFSK